MLLRRITQHIHHPVIARLDRAIQHILATSVSLTTIVLDSRLRGNERKEEV